MNAGRIYALCLRLIADKELADQITKSVFLFAWKNISIFRTDIPFSSWLCSIAVYSSLENLRQNNSAESNINEKKLKGLNVGAFEQEIILLPEKERLTFVLHELEKYTEEETAELLLMKTEEVKKNLNNARARLKAASGSLSQVTPLSERISSLTNRIIPGSEIWKQIAAEIQTIKVHSNIKEEESNSSDESQNQKQGKKFNIFGWKRK